MGYQKALVRLADGDSLKVTIFNADQFELPADRPALDTRDIVDIRLVATDIR